MTPAGDPKGAPTECPFCGSELKEQGGYDDKKNEWYARYDCGTLPYYGEEERTRSHQCYMNQIRELQTGDETQYGQGWQDGIAALTAAFGDLSHAWKLKHPPMRRPGAPHRG